MTGALVKGFVIWKTYDKFIYLFIKHFLESRDLLWPLDRRVEDDNDTDAGDDDDDDGGDEDDDDGGDEDGDDDGDGDGDGDGDEDGEDWICWQSDWTADPAIALHQQLTSLTCRLDDYHDSGELVKPMCKSLCPWTWGYYWPRKETNLPKQVKVLLLHEVCYMVVF